MAEQFTKHRQPWKAEEVGKLRTLAGKGKGRKKAPAKKAAAPKKKAAPKKAAKT